MLFRITDINNKNEYEIKPKNGMVCMIPYLKIEESHIALQSDYQMNNNMLRMYDLLLKSNSRFKVEIIDGDLKKTFTANLAAYFIDYLYVDFYCPVDRIFFKNVETLDFELKEIASIADCEKLYVKTYKTE